MKTYRIEEYKAAKKFFESYMKNKRDYAIIHYACQGFYSCEKGKSPRIAAICIFYPSSGQQHAIQPNTAPAPHNRRGNIHPIILIYLYTVGLLSPHTLANSVTFILPSMKMA